MARIALATAARLPHPDEDLAPLLAALDGAAEAVAWDSGADWSSYELVVVRSTWDYALRRAEFLSWARTVPRLANPAEVLTWNTDKTYLRDLAAAGVPVVPTTWLGPGDRFVPPDGAFVVKPTVSAGARDTARYDEPSEAAAGQVDGLLAAGRPVMVQPYLAGVDSAGETSVLLFEGQVSHGIRKGPLLGPAAGGEISSRRPSHEQVAVALAAVEVAGGRLLYARVDLVPGVDGRPVVLELELTEPSLFLSHSPGATARFAAAVLARADRSWPGASGRQRSG